MIIYDNFIDNFPQLCLCMCSQYPDASIVWTLRGGLFEYFPDGEEDGGEEEDDGGINAGGGELAVE